MLFEYNPYKNVVLFPSGKPFSAKKSNKMPLTKQINDFKDYILAVEFMVKSFKEKQQNSSNDNTKDF